MKLLYLLTDARRGPTRMFTENGTEIEDVISYSLSSGGALGRARCTIEFYVEPERIERAPIPPTLRVSSASPFHGERDW